ncbi:MAG TPA: ATP-binding cassette domain-containing protein [Thermoanaerobaculia bacterium]|nr:ATP-binding cassette domain-containing protein [Thermoanaerobaculia bacterium]
MAAQGAALAFEGVSKSYGDVLAVRDVSFEVHSAEVFGLVGPNGAGKTTLLRILMDVLRPSAGAVHLFGEPLRRHQLDRVGYLPEERGLYRKRRVIDVMVYFGTLKGLDRDEARERARRWLERVGLAETERWRIERLSKGMAQKVQIASTLMTEPELCVLDEPFSGLDPVNVRLVRELLRERQAEGLTTILSTHQMDRVEELCDRVAMIHRGRLLVYGPVDEVRRAHSTPAVRLRSSGPPPSVAGVLDMVEERDGGWLLHHDGVAPSALLRRLVEGGAEISQFEEVLAPMEEVFVRVVEGETAMAAAGGS